MRLDRLRTIQKLLLAFKADFLISQLFSPIFASPIHDQLKVSNLWRPLSIAVTLCIPIDEAA
jgi:hypothetical protein